MDGVTAIAPKEWSHPPGWMPGMPLHQPPGNTAVPVGGAKAATDGGGRCSSKGVTGPGRLALLAIL